ncbi:ribonuclease H1 [Xylariaceae sp. FL1019]|nr:ribonuclease H1 [Xylariaceae sp. FL1019]
MVYIMTYNVDGACRHGGSPRAIGAAACCSMNRRDVCHGWIVRSMKAHPRPSSQRVALFAIILALDSTLKRHRKLRDHPDLDVEIRSASRFAVRCMNTWVHNCARNGWRHSDGARVRDRDLLELAFDLHNNVKLLGSVTYTLVPRYRNQDAEVRCEDTLDRMEGIEPELKLEY